MSDLCPEETNVTEVNNSTYSCQNVTLLPAELAFPVPYGQWASFFSDASAQQFGNLMEKSFVVHYWHYMMQLNRWQRQTMAANHTLYQLFKANCPLTEELALRPMLGQPYSL